MSKHRKRVVLRQRWHKTTPSRTEKRRKFWKTLLWSSKGKSPRKDGGRDARARCNREVFFFMHTHIFSKTLPSKLGVTRVNYIENRYLLTRRLVPDREKKRDRLQSIVPIIIKRIALQRHGRSFRITVFRLPRRLDGNRSF